MRVAKKRADVKRRASRSRTLVSDVNYHVRDDGTHVLTVPVFTSNPNNGQTGHTKFAGAQKSRDRKLQRAQVGFYLHLNSVPRHFRGVRLVRLAPSNPGLDTGGLWAALKGPQDEVAKHLGVDDGPNSEASWEMDSEFSPAYGVRVELTAERQETSLSVLRAQLKALRGERFRVWSALRSVGCDCDGDFHCDYCRVISEFSMDERARLVEL